MTPIDADCDSTQISFSTAPASTSTCAEMPIEVPFGDEPCAMVPTLLQTSTEHAAGPPRRSGIGYSETLGQAFTASGGPRTIA